MKKQRWYDAVFFSVGDDDLDAFASNFAGDIAFCGHTTAPKRGFCGLNVLGEVLVWKDFLNHFGIWRGGVAVVDAVDIAKDNERLHIHHGSNKPGELVVVGEHQFGDGDGIVFVNNRDNAVVEHLSDAIFLVEIVAARAEILFGGEHLPTEQIVLTEQLVITLDKARLPYGRKNLTGGNGIQLVLKLELAATGSNGTGGNDNHLDAVIVEFCYLVNQRRHTFGVERAVLVSQHVATNFYSYLVVFIIHKFK